MSASELFRFRAVRSVEAKQSGFTGLIVNSTTQTPVKQYLAQITINPGALLGPFDWLQDVSDQLGNAADMMSPGAVVALLPTDWLTQVASAAWTALAQTLADTLASLALTVRGTTAGTGNYGITVIPTLLCEEVELVTRLILVQNFVGLLAADQSLPQGQRQFQTASDVQVALSFRYVALPAIYFTNTPPVLARQPGVTDLSVVKDEWNRYIPGEIANVVNVLPGETLATSTRHLEETVQTRSVTTQQTTTQTTENSQTTTQTLSSTATDDASMNIGVQGQVQTSGQYGPTFVQTNLGAQLQISKSTATTTALTKSVQTVARAVKTVSETVTQSQTTRTTIKDASREKHSLQNSTANVVVGMYRWLSEVHRVQLINYPNRFVVEFEIPEPGAWLEYALQNQPGSPWDNPDPGPFAVNGNDPRLDPNDPRNPDPTAMPLRPTDLTPAIAAGLAARWQVQGLTSPPPATITLANSYAITPQANAPVVFNDNSMLVPNGYVAQTWTLDVMSMGGDDGQRSTNLRVSVGGYAVHLTVEGKSKYQFFMYNSQGLGTGSGSAGGVWEVDQENPSDAFTYPPALGTPPATQPFPVGDINTGSIPVSVNATYLASGSGITLNVGVQCIQIPSVGDGAPPKIPPNGQPYVDWQIATFNTVAAAYQNLLSAHNQERDARLQNQAGPLVVGPPALNQSRAVAELKRLAIQNLLGQPFMGYDLLTIGPTGPSATIPNLAQGEPGLDPSVTVASNPVVQFFEQAFEWENIVYICYPYFWGGRQRWVQNATSASADPIFDQFLNAGSARLVVPARPGFEQMVNFYLYTSCIWSGQNPPAPNDPGYLSVADEIQAIQVGATDGTPIYPPWEIVLPTTLLWAGTDPTTLPTNPNPTIGPPPAPPASVALSVASSSNPSVFGQPVSFTVTVSAAAGTPGAVPTGQVDFLIDGTQTADSPVALNASGLATCAQTSTLTVGSHAVSVNYLGDSTFGPAIVNPPPQVVNQATTSVTVTGNPNPVVHRRRVTFTAVVSAAVPAAGTPTGQVEFIVDGTQTADSPVTLDNTGKATCAAISTLTIGAHTVEADYLGDAHFAAATGTITETAT